MQAAVTVRGGQKSLKRSVMLAVLLIWDEKNANTTKKVESIELKNKRIA